MPFAGEHRRPLRLVVAAGHLVLLADGKATVSSADGTHLFEGHWDHANWNSHWLIVLRLSAAGEIRSCPVWRHRQPPGEFRRLRVRCLHGKTRPPHEFWPRIPKLFTRGAGEPGRPS